MKYFAQFQSGNTLTFEQANIDKDNIILKSIPYINMANVDYIIPVQDEKAQSGIVKPPTPAEIKAQEERNKEADDITLEGQLSKL